MLSFQLTSGSSVVLWLCAKNDGKFARKELLRSLSGGVLVSGSHKQLT